MMTEAHYESEAVGGSVGENGTPNVLRRQEYWTMTSGATGQLYGSHYTWNAASWTEELANLNSTGATEIGYMKALFTALPWYNLVPDQTNSFLKAGFGTYAAQGFVSASTYATAALTADGSTGVIYMPTSRTITVDMTKMRGATTARWYNPTTGTYTTVSGSPFANTNSSQTFTPPSGNHTDGTNDWILVLQS